MQRAFTLVELLVVVTIIVLLLALLMPAMSKAVYQAQLVECGGKLRSVGSGVINYAFDNRRSYPNRSNLTTFDPSHSISGPFIQPYGLALPDAQYDLRPLLSTFLQINKQLQCPLVEQLQIERDQTHVDENIFIPYTTWWGWYYRFPSTRPLAGMFKIGDRWTWTGGTGRRPNGTAARYNLLAGDYDARFFADSNQDGHINSSHPDRSPNNNFLQTSVYQSLFGVGAGPAQVYASTASIYTTRTVSNDRGLIDLNFLYDDQSVRRVTDIKRRRPGAGEDERMENVPLYHDPQGADNRRDPLYVPIQ